MEDEKGRGVPGGGDRGKTGGGGDLVAVAATCNGTSDLP